MPKIIFCNKHHKKCFYSLMKKYNINIRDNESVALFYILTITVNCRIHFLDCYDPEDRRVLSDALHYGWATISDARAIRLAYNLFNGSVPTVFKDSPDEWNNLYNHRGRFEYNKTELLECTPYSIFCDYDFGRYFYEGLRLRFTSLS